MRFLIFLLNREELEKVMLLVNQLRSKEQNIEKQATVEQEKDNNSDHREELLKNLSDLVLTSNQKDKGDRAQKRKQEVEEPKKKSQEAKTGIIDGYNKTEPSILPNVYHQEDAQNFADYWNKFLVWVWKVLFCIGFNQYKWLKLKLDKFHALLFLSVPVVYVGGESKHAKNAAVMIQIREVVFNYKN